MLKKPGEKSVNSLISRSVAKIIIHSFLFPRHHSSIFELLTRMTNADMLTSLYLFDKDLTKHLTVNIYLFNVRIVTLR